MTDRVLKPHVLLNYVCPQLHSKSFELKNLPVSSDSYSRNKNVTRNTTSSGDVAGTRISVLTEPADAYVCYRIVL